MAELLLEREANVNTQSKSGQTALMNRMQLEGQSMFS